MKKIGIIGFEGYVGSSLYEECMKRDWNVVGINRKNYSDKINDHYDILINTAMPSKRFWALKNPLEDFDASVRLTAEIIYKWDYRKIIHISSVSSRCQLDHPYGLNKKCAENLVLDSNKNNLVIRLGSMFGDGLDKGILVDLINNNEIFISGESRYNFIDIKKNAELMCDRFDRSGIIDIGAKDSISINEIVKHLGSDTLFGDRLEVQETINPEEDFPSAKDVLIFLDQVKLKGNIK